MFHSHDVNEAVVTVAAKKDTASASRHSFQTERSAHTYTRVNHIVRNNNNKKNQRNQKPQRRISSAHRLQNFGESQREYEWWLVWFFLRAHKFGRQTVHWDKSVSSLLSVRWERRHPETIHGSKRVSRGVLISLVMDVACKWNELNEDALRQERKEVKEVRGICLCAMTWTDGVSKGWWWWLQMMCIFMCVYV